LQISIEDEMDMPRVSESEFQRAFGAVIEQARHQPVTITKNDRDEVVVVSAEEYARLKRRDRQVGLAAELPEEWVDAVRQAQVPDQFAHLNAELD
jgi:prevent-host-death family protein